MAIFNSIVYGGRGEPETEIYVNNELKKTTTYLDRVDFSVSDAEAEFILTTQTSGGTVPYYRSYSDEYSSIRMETPYNILPYQIYIESNTVTSFDVGAPYYDEEEDVLYFSSGEYVSGFWKWDGSILRGNRDTYIYSNSNGYAVVDNNNTLSIYTVSSNRSLYRVDVYKDTLESSYSSQNQSLPSDASSYLNSRYNFFGPYDNKLFWMTNKGSSYRNMTYDITNNTFTYSSATGPSSYDPSNIDGGGMGMSTVISGSKCYIPYRKSNTSRSLYAVNLPGMSYTSLSNPYEVSIESTIRSTFGRYIDDDYVVFAYNSNNYYLYVHILNKSSNTWTTLLNGQTYSINYTGGAPFGIYPIPLSKYYDRIDSTEVDYTVSAGRTFFIRFNAAYSDSKVCYFKNKNITKL